MAIRNLFPSLLRKDAVPAGRKEEYPLYSLQREMNRVFDDFIRGFDEMPLGASQEPFGKFLPAVDVKENDKEIVVTAELPGLDEKDFELTLTNDALAIKGEKKEKKDDKGKDYYHMERSYGYFSRVIPLPPGISPEKVNAIYKKGILTVRLPKSDEARAKMKKIAIKAE